MVVKVDTVATANTTMSTYARLGLSHPRCAREPLLLGAMSWNTGLNDKLSLKCLISCTVIRHSPQRYPKP